MVRARVLILGLPLLLVWLAGCGVGDTVQKATGLQTTKIQTLEANHTDCDQATDLVHDQGQDVNAGKIYRVHCAPTDQDFGRRLLRNCTKDPDYWTGVFVLYDAKRDKLQPLLCRKVTTFARNHRIPIPTG
jgi:hypothetical protein